MDKIDVRRQRSRRKRDNKYRINTDGLPLSSSVFLGKEPSPFGTVCLSFYKEIVMAKEIERKFLVVGDAWKKLAQGVHYRQGYLNSMKERTVRIRTVGDKAFMTVKGPTVGVTRLEFEYPIPFEDCVTMLEHLAEQPIIEKTRYKIPMGEFVWEIDEFHGVNEGLIVAEIELKSEDQAFEKPTWIGEEVSGDPRYYNSMLVAHPYSTWNK